MKSLRLISAIYFMSLTTCAFAQYDWSDIQYHYQTGAIAPPYFYQYDVNITSLGKGFVILHTSYLSDTAKKDFTYDFELPPSELDPLNKKIVQTKILTNDLESMPPGKIPIGGAMQRVVVTLTQSPETDHKPVKKEGPYFPKSSKTRKALNKLYYLIKSLVPQNIWDDITAKTSK